MKKQLELSKEQAQTLYNLLTGFAAPDRSANRKKYNFLKVIEDFTFEYDDQLVEIEKKMNDLLDELRDWQKQSEEFRIANPAPKLLTQREVDKMKTEMGKETKKFIFPDREIFARVKEMFEKCYKTGTKFRDQMGKTESSPLVGRSAEIYMELEDRFADVVEIKEGKKK